MLCMNIVGKHQMTTKKGDKKYAMIDKEDKNVYLQEITMIDPASKIKIRYMPEARADLVAN